MSMSNTRKIRTKKPKRKPQGFSGPTTADVAALALQMLEGAEQLTPQQQIGLIAFSAGVAEKLIDSERSSQ
jgi:hypothetical protein